VTEMKNFRRFLLPLAGLAAVLMLSVPFIFWYQTWFGRPLADAEIGHYLNPESRPRDMQHAMSQLAGRMERGDSRVRRWYPEIVALARQNNVEVRIMAAWVMGQDNQSELFHAALLAALNDSQVMVRRNAALALVRFGDAAGRAEMVRILQTERDETQIWEALRGLYVVGQPEDLAAVESASESTAIRAQAEYTVQAIRARADAVRLHE
jgi:hypothetical protein